MPLGEKREHLWNYPLSVDPKNINLFYTIEPVCNHNEVTASNTANRWFLQSKIHDVLVQVRTNDCAQHLPNTLNYYFDRLKTLLNGEL